MEALALILIIVAAIAALVTFDVLALTFGVDSRGAIGDDHARHAGF